MAGEMSPGLIFGSIVDDDLNPLAGVQVDISFVRCDQELNGGVLTITPMGGNRLRGATNNKGVFCVGFEWQPYHQAYLVSRVYEARLVALQFVGDTGNQARPAVRFSAQIALALDVRNWFLNGIGAPNWNSPWSAALSTAASTWGTYRSAVKTASGVKAGSFPNVPTMSIEHFGLLGDSGMVKMPSA